MTAITIRELAVLVKTAEDLRRRGGLAEARATYAAAVAARLASVGGVLRAMSPQDALVVEQLGMLLLLFGEEEAAATMFTTAASVFDRHGDSARADSARLKRLHMFLSAGDLGGAIGLITREFEPRIGSLSDIELTSEGLRRFEEGIDWPADRKRRLTAELCLELGRFLTAQGQCGGAMALLARGQGLAEETAPELLTPLMLATAAAQIALCDMRGADESLATLATLDHIRHPGWALEAYVLRARNAFLAGKLHDADEALMRATELAAETGSSVAAGRALAQLVEVKLALNQTGAAERLLEQLKSLAGRGDGTRVRVLHQRMRRALIERPDDLRTVIELQEAASDGRRTDEHGPDSPSEDRDPSFLSWFDARAMEVRLSLNEPARAAELLAALKRVFDRSDSPVVQIRIEVLEAMILLRETALFPDRSPGRFDHAVALLRRAAEACDRLGLVWDAYEALRHLSFCARVSDTQASSLDALIGRKQERLEQLMAGLSAAERAQFLLDKWRDEDDTLALSVNRFLAARERIRTRAGRWLFTVRSLHVLLEDVYASRHPGTKRPSLLRRVVAAGRRRLTLAFVALPRSLVVFRIGRFALDVEVLPDVARTDMRALVRRWHEAASGSSDEKPETVASELAALLRLEHLLGDTEDISALTFVPDDALRGLPFAALPFRGQYLVERFALSVAFEPTPRHSRSRALKKAFILAVDRALQPHWAALPRTRDQVDALERWLERHRLNRDVAINDTEPNDSVLRRMASASLVHISCHGTFAPELPEKTGLVLPDRDARARILSVGALAHAELPLLEHVTLLSCWGADSYILPGRWAISLPQTFHRCGARSVLASLWEIDGNLLAHFTRDFYSALETLPRDEALRAVQLAWIRDPANRDPIRWAGFQLSGDVRRLRW
jgi:CHAT domain-containing protein